MALENKLGLISSADLAREEERLSKKKAVELFENGVLEPYRRVNSRPCRRFTNICLMIFTTLPESCAQ